MCKKIIAVITLLLLASCAPVQQQPLATQTTGKTYYVSPTGNDNASGAISAPFKTYKKAMAIAPEGSTIVIRAGTYSGGGADFASNNVTVKNYPNEQVVIQLKDGSNQAFNCWTTASFGAKSDIKIIGSDVTPRTLSNGVVSKKGIVIMDSVGSQRIAFHPHGGCDRWEIAGIDFIDVADAIFQLKENGNGKTYQNYSADGWYVHDNRVFRFYREVGMQFNGNDNIIENNEIVKGTSQLNTSFGCYLLNLVGHGNTVRNNALTGTGGTECSGVLLEWSQSDANLIDNNVITGVKNGIEIQGGDNNRLVNNKFSGVVRNIIQVNKPLGTTAWACSDYAGSWDTYTVGLIPPNDPKHPDYAYYYPYGECQSLGNVIIDAQEVTGTPTVTPTGTNTATATLRPTATRTVTNTPTPTATALCVQALDVWVCDKKP